MPISPFINTLQVSAPEINGMWNMYPVPSGDQYRRLRIQCKRRQLRVYIKSERATRRGVGVFEGFTDEEEQYDYAMAIENLQGEVGQGSAPQMLRRLTNFPLKKSTLQQINVQRDKAVGVQQVPGGYFLSRHIDNIYRAVKNDGDDVRQTVLEYTDVINAELTRKRKEFRLETAE